MATDELRKRLSQFLIKRDFDDIEAYIQSEVEKRSSATKALVKDASIESAAGSSPNLSITNSETNLDLPTNTKETETATTNSKTADLSIVFTPIDIGTLQSTDDTVDEQHLDLEVGFQTQSYYQYDGSDESNT